MGAAANKNAAQMAMYFVIPEASLRPAPPLVVPGGRSRRRGIAFLQLLLDLLGDLLGGLAGQDLFIPGCRRLHMDLRCCKRLVVASAGQRGFQAQTAEAGAESNNFLLGHAAFFVFRNAPFDDQGLRGIRVVNHLPFAYDLIEHFGLPEFGAQLRVQVVREFRRELDALHARKMLGFHRFEMRFGNPGDGGRDQRQCHETSEPRNSSHPTTSFKRPEIRGAQSYLATVGTVRAPQPAKEEELLQARRWRRGALSHEGNCAAHRKARPRCWPAHSSGSSSSEWPPLRSKCPMPRPLEICPFSGS